MEPPNHEFVSSIASDVMTCLTRSGYFEKLDDVLSPEDTSRVPQSCERTKDNLWLAVKIVLGLPLLFYALLSVLEPQREIWRKADEKGAGSFPHRMGRGRLFHCARFRLERSEVGNLLYRLGRLNVFPGAIS